MMISCNSRRGINKAHNWHTRLQSDYWVRDDTILISSVFRIEIRKGWICGNLITKEVLEIRNPWGRTVWKGNDVTAELTERKKKSLGICRDIEGVFYVSKEDFVKVSY